MNRGIPLLLFLLLGGIARAGESPVPGYRLQKDIPYRDGNGLSEHARERCRLDVYWPTNRSGFSTVVWFHGGGLTGGGKSVPAGLKDRGIAVVAAGYRLSPHVTAPEYVRDAAAAVAWTFRHMPGLGGSTNLIFVSGHSAGGYLAAMVGLDRRWLAAEGLDADRIAGLIPLSPQAITHFTIRSERGLGPKQPVLDDLAPLYHVRPDAPPLLLITGDREQELYGRYEENAYFWRMLKVAGHPDVGLRELEGFNHGDMAAPAMPLLVDFVARRTREAGMRAPVWRSGTHQLTFDGRSRTFLLDVPEGLKPGAPLVLVFHGFNGSATAVRERSGFSAVGAKHGFVTVYPEGTRDSRDRAFFNVGYEFHRDQSVDDVGFVRQLTARLTQDLGLDPRAVFATGFSNGGDMCLYLGAQREPFVAAIAPVAGTMMRSWAAGFRPAARISVLAVALRDDPTTLWDGDLANRDGWGAYLGTEAVLDLWSHGLGLESAVRSEITDNIELRRWTTASDSTEVRLYAVKSGGHHWPPHLGDDREPTAEVLWRFFEAHRPRSP